MNILDDAKSDPRHHHIERIGSVAAKIICDSLAKFVSEFTINYIEGQFNGSDYISNVRAAIDLFYQTVEALP